MNLEMKSKWDEKCYSVFWRMEEDSRQFFSVNYYGFFCCEVNGVNAVKKCVEFFGIFLNYQNPKWVKVLTLKHNYSQKMVCDEFLCELFKRECVNYYHIGFFGV